MATSISSISQQKDKIHPTPHPYLMLLPQEKQYFFILLVTWTFFHVIQPWTQKPQDHKSQAFTSSKWLAWQMAHLTTTSLQVTKLVLNFQYTKTVWCYYRITATSHIKQKWSSFRRATNGSLRPKNFCAAITSNLTAYAWSTKYRRKKN